MNTWLDRPLGIAGRVVLASGDPFAPEERLYDSGRPILTVPNLAIHMNPEINKGQALNRQTDLMPLFAAEVGACGDGRDGERLKRRRIFRFSPDGAGGDEGSAGI